MLRDDQAMGRSGDFCRAVKEGGITEAVAVDVECARACTAAGLELGHVGHLVQVPGGVGRQEPQQEAGHGRQDGEGRRRRRPLRGVGPAAADEVGGEQSQRPRGPGRPDPGRRRGQGRPAGLGGAAAGLRDPPGHLARMNQGGDHERRRAPHDQDHRLRQEAGPGAGLDVLQPEVRQGAGEEHQEAERRRGDPPDQGRRREADVSGQEGRRPPAAEPRRQVRPRRAPVELPVRQAHRDQPHGRCGDHQTRVRPGAAQGGGRTEYARRRPEVELFRPACAGRWRGGSAAASLNRGRRRRHRPQAVAGVSAGDCAATALTEA